MGKHPEGLAPIESRMERIWGTQKSHDVSPGAGALRGSPRVAEGASPFLLCWRRFAGFLCRPDAPHKKQEILPVQSAGHASIETSPEPVGSIKSNPQGPILTATGSGLSSPSFPNHRPSPRPAAWLSRSETARILRIAFYARTASNRDAACPAFAGCSYGEPAPLSCTLFQGSRTFSEGRKPSSAMRGPPPPGEVYTPILGHRSATGQTGHFGLRAVQILRP